MAAHRLARRANALVLLDDGMSCEAIAKVLLLDDDTIRTFFACIKRWDRGVDELQLRGSACQLSGEQQEKLKAWVATALPRTTRQVGAWIENEFGVVYEGRSGLIALLHRLGLEYHKPNVIPRKLDEEKQRLSLRATKLLNSLATTRPCCCGRRASDPCGAACRLLAPSQEKLAIEQTSGVNASTFTARSTWRLANPDDRGPDHRRRLDDQLLQSIERSIRCWRSSMFS